MGKKNLIIIMVFILLSLLWCFVPVLIARCGAAEMNSAGTAASNIADAARGNNNAEKAIQRSDAELERGQAAAEDCAERINRIEQLVKECIDRNRQALDIMQRIEAANTAGKEKSQP